MCPAVLAPAGILDRVVMKVSIVQLSGEIFEVDVEPSASVRELQRRAYGVQRGQRRAVAAAQSVRRVGDLLVSLRLAL